MLDLTKPLQTRNGVPVRYLGTLKSTGGYPLIIAIQDVRGNELAENRPFSGISSISRGDDIINVPEKVTRWMNFYKGWAIDYPSKEAANARAFNADGSGIDYRLACVPVTFTVGEGL